MQHSDFGDLLYAHIESCGLTVSDFCRQVGFSKQSLTNIKNGRRPVPLEHLEPWADVLKLTGMDREVFLDSGTLTHAPERLRQMIARIEAKTGKPLRHQL